MFKPSEMSISIGGDPSSGLGSLTSPQEGECHFVLHNSPPKVTVGGYCSYDGATAFRAKIQQFRGEKLFSEACCLYRGAYDVCKNSIEVEDYFGFGDCCYRKAAKRELGYLKTEDRTPIGDVFEFPEFHLVFSCHIGDGLLDFRNGISDVVVIYGWRMFERVRSLCGAYEIVHDQLYRMGFKIIEYSIRRVDFNITTSEIPIQIFGEAYRKSSFKTRARNTQIREGSPGVLQTLYVGKVGGSVQFRAYDKTQELKQLANKFEAREKANAIFSKLGLVRVSQITRIEFELGAQFFVDFEISTFEELETKLNAIILYLFRDWLRFLEDDRETYKHKDREKVVKWWLDCQEMLSAWAGSIQSDQDEQQRQFHTKGNGSRLQALARAFVLVAAAEFKRAKELTGSDFDSESLGKELAALLERAEIPRWGGAVSKRDFMINYEMEKAREIKEERERRAENVLENCELVQEMNERERQFRERFAQHFQPKNEDSEILGGQENAKTQDEQTEAKSGLVSSDR